MILGLDISTSCTGVTVLDKKGDVILNEAWSFKKEKTFLDKCKRASERIQIIYDLFGSNIEKIYVEESLQAFRAGYSSAKTLLTLAKFNGILSWMLVEKFGLEPEYIPAVSARKLCEIKVPKGVKAKQVVMEYMLENHDWFNVEYTRYGNIKSYYYDMADSYIIAEAGRRK